VSEVRVTAWPAPVVASGFVHRTWNLNRLPAPAQKVVASAVQGGPPAPGE
jgi:hypothetical protein